MIENVGVALIAAVIYSGSMYLKKMSGPGAEAFDWMKFLATMLVGLFVGLLSGYTGIIPTESGIVEQMGAYAGLVVVVQTWVQMVWSKVKPT